MPGPRESSIAGYSESRRAQTVCALLTRLLPAKCGTGCRLSAAAPDFVFPIGREAVKAAVPARQNEFVCGRAAARDAMACIGAAIGPIPLGPRGAPIWPADLIGSIAHKKGIAVAVVARQSEIVALGVDIEETGAVTEEIWPEIFVAPERAFLGTLPPPQRTAYATAMFAVKEAFYKFQYPHTAEWLEFKDVEVSPHDTSSQWLIRPNRPLSIGGEARSTFLGRTAMQEGDTLAAVSLPATDDNLPAASLK